MFLMNNQSDILRADSWGSALGDDSDQNNSEVIALNQPIVKHLPDSAIRKNTGKATNRNQPAIKGRILQSVVLQPGGIREAHFHPNTAQIDFVVSGSARIGIMGQKVDLEIHHASEGEAVLIPVGSGHWIENTGTVSPLFVLVLANEDE